MEDIPEEFTDLEFSNPLIGVFDLEISQLRKDIQAGLDCYQRIEFFNSWITRGEPLTFDLRFFEFPRAFLFSVLQKFNRLSEDNFFDFTIHILDEFPTSKYENGICLTGLKLCGGKWDSQQRAVVEPDSNGIFEAPCFLLIPFTPRTENDFLLYSCPIFSKTNEFIWDFDLPTLNTSSYWCQRGLHLRLE